MEELKRRFERIRSAVAAHLNESDSTSFPTVLRGESITRNINYHRRALYSDVELFKMELEEYLGSDEADQVEGGKRENFMKDDRPQTSPDTIRSPLLARRDDSSPIMASRATDILAANNSYMKIDGDIDGYNSSSNINNNSSTYGDNYNDIDTNGSTDRDRLLESSIIGPEISISKYSIIVDKDGDEKENNEKVLSVTKGVLSLAKTRITEHSESDIAIITQMIEECSSMSANFGLKFADRNPHWYVTAILLSFISTCFLLSRFSPLIFIQNYSSSIFHSSPCALYNSTVKSIFLEFLGTISLIL